MEYYKTTHTQTRADMIRNDSNESANDLNTKIINSRDSFLESDFKSLVDNIIHNRKINFSMYSLKKITSLKGFRSDTIEYLPLFIDKIVEILNIFLESSDPPSIPILNNNDRYNIPYNEPPNFLLLINTAKLLINICSIKKHKENMPSFEMFINQLIHLILKLNYLDKSELGRFYREFSIASISAITNYSSYIPTLVIGFCIPDFFDLIISNICNKNSFGLQLSSIRLVLTFCKNENVLDMHPYLSTTLPPPLIQAFNQEVFEYSTMALQYLIQKFNDESLACALSAGLIENLILPFKYYDRTKLKSSFSIAYFCIDRVETLQNELNQKKVLNDSQNFILQCSDQIYNTFYSTEFTKVLVSGVVQFYSERSINLFNMIEKMMDKMWRVFFNEGLIEQILLDAPNVEFHNKQYSAMCITKFLEIISSFIGNENKTFKITPDVSEFCSNWGNNCKNCAGPDENDEENDGDDYNEFVNKLSNSHVRYCVVLGGGLSFLISILTSIKNLNLLIRILEIIYHLITTGPPCFSQIAAEEDIIDNCNTIEEYLSENNIENDEASQHILYIISLIFQFYNYNK